MDRYRLVPHGGGEPLLMEVLMVGSIHQVMNRPSFVCTKLQATSKPQQIASQACVRSMAGCPRVGNAYGCGVQTPKGNGDYARTRDSDRFCDPGRQGLQAEMGVEIFIPCAVQRL